MAVNANVAGAPERVRFQCGCCRNGTARASARASRRGGGPRSIGLAAAIAAHAAVLAAFALMGPPEPSGGGGQWLEAISVEVVLAQAVEARDTQQPDTT